MAESLASRFINAYNEVDYALRTIYGQKRNITFSDAVRRSVAKNSVIRKYEEKLIDYGRLRNSIVHTYNPKMVMAEPHEDVVLELEKIARLLTVPPKALTVARKEVAGVDGNQSIRETLILAAETGFSNIPVYENEAIIGVANLKILAVAIGNRLSKGADINDFLYQTKIKDVIDKLKEVNYYKIIEESCTVEQVLNLFYENSKLTCVIITKKGNFLEKPLGIITSGDVLEMNNIIEEY